MTGTWWWGNSADHIGWDVHAWPGHRYSVDLSIVQGGQTFEGSKDEDNSRFYCWDQEILCVADGKVFDADDTSDDHDAFLDYAPPGTNFVRVLHGTNRLSGYFHLKKNSLQVSANRQVQAGDVVARVGNSGGSSEPHLHMGFSEIDKTGRLHQLPMRFVDLLTEQNEYVNVVPGTGSYVS